MIDTITLSIIIPAYNTEKYIAEALQSIKRQTTSPDEIIIVNDGSTDRTYEIAADFEFGCRHTLVSIENSGQGAARNLGVALASSEYIYFFDSDDLIEIDFVEKIKRELSRAQRPDIILFSGEAFFDSDFLRIKKGDYKRGFCGKFADAHELIVASSSLSLSLSHSPCLYVSKRMLWGSEKLKFISYFFEDSELFHKLLLNCSSIQVINDCLFRRRVRENSTMTMRWNRKHALGALACLESSMDICIKFGPETIAGKVFLNLCKNYFFRYITCCRDTRLKPELGIMFSNYRLFGSWKFITKCILVYFFPSAMRRRKV